MNHVLIVPQNTQFFHGEFLKNHLDFQSSHDNLGRSVQKTK